LGFGFWLLAFGFWLLAFGFWQKTRPLLFAEAIVFEDKS
jgi:hypothetical protein